MDQLTLLTSMTDEDDESILQSFLENCKQIILNELYPHIEYDSEGKEIEREMPKRYEWLQTRMAAYLLNKRGADGESGHVENGITRHYDSSDIPDDMLREITPFAKVLK